MINSTSECSILSESAQRSILEKWQKLIDLITIISGAHVGLIMQLCENRLQVHTASHTTENPYHVGDSEHIWGSGLYCERVLTTNKMLLVPNAVNSSEWDHNPDLKYNLVAYLGFPIRYPSGGLFGTICILDKSENSYTPELIQVMEQFRDQIESELVIEDLLRINTAQIEVLQRQKKLCDLITLNTSDVIWILNVMKNRFTYISPSIFQLRGLTVEEAMKEPLEESMMPESLALVNQKISDSIGVFIRDGVQSELNINEIQQPCKNGRVIWIEVTTRYAMNDQGEVEIIGISRNIDERKQKEKEIEYLSTHDFLTRLYNRSYFEREAEREITRIQRYQAPLSLLMLDIDLFKKINDQFGHLAGDQVLQALSKLVSSLLRSTDVFARYGGEEFIILLPETDLSGATRTAEKIRQTIENATFLQCIKLTISIGVNSYQAGESLDELLRKTDVALYRAKAKGRNCVGISE